MRKLRRAFPCNARTKENMKNKRNLSKNETGNMDSETGGEVEIDEEEMELDMQKAIQNARKARRKHKGEVTLPDINLDNYSVIPGDDTEVDLLEEDDLGDIESDEDEDGLHLRGLSVSQPLWVLPMYSLLPSNKQALVSICTSDFKSACITWSFDPVCSLANPAVGVHTLPCFPPIFYFLLSLCLF